MASTGARKETVFQVLVFGAGGVVCTYGYFLSQVNASVTVVCRGNYQAMEHYGIIVQSSLFGTKHTRPKVVQNAPEPSETNWNYAMVCTKAFSGTAELIKDVVAPSTVLVLAQNGIEIEEGYAKLYPDNHIISGVVYLPVMLFEPGVNSHSNIELLKLGAYPLNASQERTEEFANLLRAGGASARVFSDLQSEHWQKLLVNVNCNPVCALTRWSDTDFLRSTEKGAKDFIAIMNEVVSIAQASAYSEIDQKSIQFQIERNLAQLDGEGVEPSILADVKHGRILELEAIVGNTVRIAKHLQIETSKLDVIYVLIRALNAGIVGGH